MEYKTEEAMAALRKLKKEKEEQDKLIEEAVNAFATLGSTITEIVFLIATGPFALLLKGWIISRLWHWFVVPLGAVELRAGMVAGIILIYNFVTATSSPKKEDDKDSLATKIAKTILSSFVAPTAVLLVGWFLHWMTK